jgi:general secretion pathway protein G
MNILNKKISKNKGFTLVELLVVVSIISLLSSIVLASLNSARAKGRDARRNEDLISIRNALALYASDNNGNFPSGHLWSSTAPGGPYAWTLLQTTLSPYIASLPVDPLNNDGVHDYYYTGGFSTGWMTSGTSGTCLGKAIIMAYSTESGPGRHDCTLNSGATEQYPNEIVIQLN